MPGTKAAGAVAIATMILACGAESAGKRSGLAGLRLMGGSEQPDEPPVLVNGELPFRYPPPLYARKAQGNVTLRLYVDRDGHTLADSTRVEESSGYESLDSAAVTGSRELQFVPAKLQGEAVGVTILFPVYFRHPEAAPLPGDTILVRQPADSSGSR